MKKQVKSKKSSNRNIHSNKLPAYKEKFLNRLLIKEK